jgi:hypothetical protein
MNTKSSTYNLTIDLFGISVDVYPNAGYCVLADGRIFAERSAEEYITSNPPSELTMILWHLLDNDFYFQKGKTS